MEEFKLARQGGLMLVDVDKQPCQRAKSLERALGLPAFASCCDLLNFPADAPPNILDQQRAVLWVIPQYEHRVPLCEKSDI